MRHIGYFQFGKVILRALSVRMIFSHHESPIIIRIRYSIGAAIPDPFLCRSKKINREVVRFPVITVNQNL
mgnify:FL=1